MNGRMTLEPGSAGANGRRLILSGFSLFAGYLFAKPGGPFTHSREPCAVGSLIALIFGVFGAHVIRNQGPDGI